MNIQDEAVALTKKLVSIPSVNGTPGEKDIAEFIYTYLSELPYFEKHPDQLVKAPIPDDSLGRFSVLALFVGEKDDNPDTIMLHSHMDTVPVEDYGALREYAFDCDALLEKFLERKETLPEDMRKDLESGRYMVGRGCGDMKGGDAINMVLMKHRCMEPEKYSGNLLISCNCVEETLHLGIIYSLDAIENFKDKYGLNYRLAINLDFGTENYPGDPIRHMYSGVVGKVLPCFYVRGIETHVGQAFNGVDPNYVVSEIVRALNLNPAYCDNYEKDFPQPPVTLKVQDLKPTYTVQTPIDSFCYFNYFVQTKSNTQIMKEMKDIAASALHETVAKKNANYKMYCAMAGITYQPYKVDTEVLEYRELLARAARHFDGDLDACVEELAKSSIAAGDDMRITSLKIVRKLTDIAEIRIPTAVVFFAVPYCPHNTLKDEVPEEKALSDEIKGIVAAFSKETGEPMDVMHFFPSLSDSSYIRIDDDDESVAALHENFPGQDQLYPLNYEQMKRLNIPAVNFGEYGKNCHSWRERVDVPFSFGILPELIQRTLDHFLEE